MKRIQKEVNAWVGQYTEGYWKPAEIMLRLSEEVGELAREINHRYGPKKKKGTEDQGDVALEMADVIFTVVCLANSLKIDLDAAYELMMKKIRGRDNKRWKKKS